MSGLTHTQGEVLGRAGLHHVLGFEIAFPMFLVVAGPAGEGAIRIGLGAVDVVTFDVTRHNSQARHAEAGHVQVVTNLQGTLVGRVEVGVLHRVRQPDRVAADVVEELVAVDLLVGQAQLVRAKAVGTLERVGQGVEVAGQGLALIVGLVGNQVEAQGLVVAQRQAVIEVAEVLAPDVFGFAAVEHHAEVVVDGVATTEEVDAAGFDFGVFSGQRAVGVARVATVDRGEVTGLEGEVLELVAAQLKAGGGFRQQARVAGGPRTRSLFPASTRQARYLVTSMTLGLSHPESFLIPPAEVPPAQSPLHRRTSPWRTEDAFIPSPPATQTARRSHSLLAP